MGQFAARYGAMRRLGLYAALVMWMALLGAAHAAVPQWDVEFASGVTAVGGSFSTNCAVVDGALNCWGSNTYGQVGDGTTVRRVDPLAIFAQGATAVTGGSLHTCAIVSGAVHCWGGNAHGQLGNGTTTPSLTPVATTITANATAVSSTWLTNCAVVGGAAKCWGNNMFGQVGNGSQANALAPVTVIASGVTAIGSGMQHSCALVGSAVQCWGSNAYGQVGSGLTQDEKSPLTVIASGATAIAVGHYHSCAVVNGAVKCWGYNDQGQIGDGSTTNRATPVTIIASGATSVTAGDSLTCALVDGALQCWGIGGAAGFPAALSPTSVAMAGGSIVASFGTTRIINSGVMSCTGFCAPLNMISFELPTMVMGTDMLVNATSLGQLTFASTTPSICTVSSVNKVTPVAPGTCTIVASSVPSALTRTADPVSRSTSVKAGQTITIGAIAALYTGASVELSATASSGLPVAFASITPGYCTVSGTTLTAVAAGTCQVTASQQGNTVYAPAPFVTRMAFVQARYSQAISLELPASMPLGSDVMISFHASSGLAVTIASLSPDTCTLSNGVLTPVAIGTCTLSAKQGGNAIYTAAPDVTRSTIIALSQMIMFEYIPTQALVNATVALSATASSGLPVTFSSLTPGICTVSDATLTTLTAGDCLVAATQQGNADYAAADASTMVLVGEKYSQFIWLWIPDPLMVGTTSSMFVGTTSELPVTLTSLTPDVCTIGTDGILAVSPGTCTVVASQAGDTSYFAAADETYSTTVVTEEMYQSIMAGMMARPERQMRQKVLKK
jgi:alpha-tubulin suppressor-like RCC1 family protein